MRNDSLETLLLRHYGDAAQVPAGLEQRLLASTQQEATAHKQQTLRRLYARRLSRRQALRLVAFGSAGIGMLDLGLKSLQAVERNLLGQDMKRPALP